MSSQLTQEFKARGVATVIAYLSPGAAAGSALGLAVAMPKKAPKVVLGCFTDGGLFTASAQLAEAHLTAGAAATTGPIRELAAAAKAASKPKYYPNLGVVLGTVDKEGLAALKKLDEVQSVSAAPVLSLIRPLGGAPAKLQSPLTWGLRRIGVEDVWNAGHLGSGVVVGHLDTGVDASHDALAAAIAAYAEFNNLGELIENAPARDSGDHGTHTAGTIAGRAVNGRSIGVAPEARIVSAMVIEGGDVIARILGGLDWVIGMNARVLSMSLGLRGWWEDFVPLVRRLRSRGVLPVIAAGNEGAGFTRSPGNYPEALSVGAIDSNGQVASFSSSQRFNRAKDPIIPDVVAPGVAVLSSIPGNAYAEMPGTSMATPHVAGIAALLMSAAPHATIDQIEAAIFASSQTLGQPQARVGRGEVNAKRALDALNAALP